MHTARAHASAKQRVSVCMYAHRCVWTYSHTYACTYTYTARAHVSALVEVCMYFVYMYACTMWIRMYVGTCVCRYVCM